MMQISVDDMCIAVDNETGHCIVNDPQYAAQYMAALKGVLSHFKQPCTNSSISDTSTISPENIPESHNKVWVSPRETETDREATIMLLSLRKSLDAKFCDSKTVKNHLWENIANTLNHEGFYVGEGAIGRDKVHTKFRNLQYAFMKYNDKKKRTGEGKIIPPPYFEELNDILGDKHKVNPPLVLDSLKENPFHTQIRNASAMKESEMPGLSTDASIESVNPNRFASVKRSVKPKSSRDDMIDKILLSMENSRIQREQEFQEFKELLRDDHRQRNEQFLALLDAMKGKRKRRHSDSD